MFQKFNVSEIWCFRNFMFQKFHVSEMSCFRNFRFQNCQVSEMWGLRVQKLRCILQPKRFPNHIVGVLKCVGNSVRWGQDCCRAQLWGSKCFWCISLPICLRFRLIRFRILSDSGRIRFSLTAQIVPDSALDLDYIRFSLAAIFW